MLIKKNAQIAKPCNQEEILSKVETVKVKTKKFTFFIGIDVSKNKLDYAVMQGTKLLFHEVRKNDPDDILAFCNRLKELPGFTVTKAIFCMEATGIYCNHLISSLKKINGNAVIENPLRIKRSMGLARGKYDKADAIRIAAYAQKNIADLNILAKKRPVILELTNLCALRSRLLALSVALQNPLREQIKFSKKGLQKQSLKLCERSMDAIKADINEVESSIEMLINSDEQLKRLKQLITSVPGIGPVTSIQMIISTNEFKDIKHPKKFACYAGVAPFKSESGSSIQKARISRYANIKMKSLLHVCALNAIRGDHELKAYYERKTITEGKPKLAVINAIRYKLVLRVFACLNQDRPYRRDYERSSNPTANEFVIDQV
ncbi:MAG: family transposase [Mucilaginibacter sp.]|nr:family transposase [Mucilaginibacter sp.]